MASWTRKDIPDLSGRLAVVTGGSSGLGLETALALAGAGAEVVLTGRNEQKGREALQRIHQEVKGAKVSFKAFDLGDLESVADFAAAIRPRKRIHILVNNAGVMALPRRETTVDDFEMQFGSNYLGHFALTAHLLPLLSEGQARVVSLSSVAHRTGVIDFADLQGTRWYSPWKAYCQSKLAMLIFARELQRRSDQASWGLTSIAAHPGWSQTALFNGPGGLFSMFSQIAGPMLGQSAVNGALPILYAATSPDAVPGGYYGPGGPGELRGPPARALVMAQALRPDTAERLWAASEELTGEHFEV